MSRDTRIKVARALYNALRKSEKGMWIPRWDDSRPPTDEELLLKGCVTLDDTFSLLQLADTLIKELKIK